MRGFVIDSMSIPGTKVLAPNERVLKIIMSPELGNHKEITLLLFVLPAPFFKKLPAVKSSRSLSCKLWSRYLPLQTTLSSLAWWVDCSSMFVGEFAELRSFDEEEKRALGVNA
jgi:hypothetical protein